MVEGSNQRVGRLIREAREAHGWTLRDLADRCGVSKTTLNNLEHGLRAVTLPVVDRIFAAMALDLHVETQPMWAAIDQAIADAAGRSLPERIAGWEIEFAPFVSWFAETPYLADGLTAAALQGAPVPVSVFEMAVPRDTESLDRLIAVISDMGATRWDVNWNEWSGGLPRDPRAAEEDALWAEARTGRSGPPERSGREYGRTAFSYRCHHGEFRLRLVERLTPTLWVDLDGLSAEHRPVGRSRAEIPLFTRVRLPVVPLAEIEVADGYARRVLQRMREFPPKAAAA